MRKSWLRFVLVAVVGLAIAGPLLAQTARRPMRSTNIELSRDGSMVILANRDSNTVSIIRVEGDQFAKLAELAVGGEPRYLCRRPGTDDVWVSDAASGTMTRIALGDPPALNGFRVVGTEPRGCAFTPNGELLFVALHTEGVVAVIDPDTTLVVDRVEVGGRPEAVAITNDGDGDDDDELVLVTQFYSQLIAGGPGDGFDDGRQGIVHVLSVNDQAVGSGVARRLVENVTLSPANSGFTADRTAFCRRWNANLHSDVYCPDVRIRNPEHPKVARNFQDAFPNQLHNLIIRGQAAYVLSTAAQPEPPVAFNTNVQSFISYINLNQAARSGPGAKEDPSRLTKLNQQIKNERPPADPIGSLDRLFANDVVAVDADEDGEEFLFVSRGGNYVIRAQNRGAGPLGIGAPDNVVRMPTGNIPTGIVTSDDFTRAYVNNEVSRTMTALDLESNEVIREISAIYEPAPGTPEHRKLVGKLAFFTSLGIGNEKLQALPVSFIEPLEHRNKASDNGWSSCASCHPDGLSDGVTWMFPTGPRQSVPMDGSWGSTPNDQRIFNWSGVRSNVRDFNNNARNVQGGEGFAEDPGSIFNHGLSNGVGDALDLMTFWLQTGVRTLNRPFNEQSVPGSTGETVFSEQCGSCHGGAKFTKSNLAFRNNPTFDANPLQGGSALDDGLDNAGPQLLSFQLGGNTVTFLDDVGTFDADDPLEIRGAGATGQTALGGLGYNAPSLLGVGSTAPYLHNGSADTLQELFAQHEIGGGPIASTLSAEEQEALLEFLEQIDGRTQPVSSDAEAFRNALSGQ